VENVPLFGTRHHNTSVSVDDSSLMDSNASDSASTESPHALENRDLWDEEPTLLDSLLPVSKSSGPESTNAPDEITRKRDFKDVSCNDEGDSDVEEDEWEERDDRSDNDSNDDDSFPPSVSRPYQKSHHLRETYNGRSDQKEKALDIFTRYHKHVEACAKAGVGLESSTDFNGERPTINELLDFMKGTDSMCLENTENSMSSSSPSSSSSSSTEHSDPGQRWNDPTALNRYVPPEASPLLALFPPALPCPIRRCRLVRRRWILRNASNGNVINVVDGSGVIGSHPVLDIFDNPFFVYRSQIATTEESILEGAFSFVTPDGKYFSVLCPPVPLKIPQFVF